MHKTTVERDKTMTTEQRAKLKALLQDLTQRLAHYGEEFRAVCEEFEIATTYSFDHEPCDVADNEPRFMADVFAPNGWDRRLGFRTAEERDEFVRHVHTYGDEVSQAEFSCSQPGRDCVIFLDGRNVGAIYCYTELRNQTGEDRYCVRIFRRQLGQFPTMMLARRAVHDFLLARGNTEQVLAYRLYDTDIILLDDGHDFHIDSIARIAGKIRVTNKAGDYREFAFNELLTCRGQ